jgi:hypothetical protein
MNKYCLTFPFQGTYEFVYLDANQLANAVLPSTDDILDFKCDTDGQDFCYPIVVNQKKYEVTFTPGEPKYVNVYNAYDEKKDEYGRIVEEKIPWLLVKVETTDDKVLYSLCDYV